MTLRSGILTAILLSLGACALPPPDRPVPRATHTESTPPALIGELARIAALTVDQRRRELAELDGARLDDTRRFQLAALLERDDSPDALERSLKNLNALGDLDARSQALVEQMKKSLKARIENRQLAARNAELQDKLEQIKALEKSLQQRSAPLKNP
ncbi:MAG: hypothetical protein IV085_04485 [Thiobacillus sp.]|nr:hypothetical protein [Thiobacillus sp.]